MLQRIAYGSLVIAFLIALMAGDSYISAHADRLPFASDLLRRGSVLPPITIALSVVAALEVIGLFRRAGFNPHRLWATVVAAFLTASPWLCAGGLLGAWPAGDEALRWQLIWLFVAVVGTAVLQITRRDTRSALGDVSATLVTIIYAGFLPSFILLLRCDTGYPGEVGPWLILMYLAVTKSSDTGAYFVGSWVGRRKLIPWVSPGKSVEGMLGGIATSVAVMVAILAACTWGYAAATEQATTGGTVTSPHLLSVVSQIRYALEGITPAQAVVFAILMSAIGQIGDLFESLFKRSAGAKDSARFLPGFGGVLDMVDSVYLTAPAAWLLLTWR